MDCEKKNQRELLEKSETARIHFISGRHFRGDICIIRLLLHEICILSAKFSIE